VVELNDIVLLRNGLRGCIVEILSDYKYFIIEIENAMGVSSSETIHISAIVCVL